jgi:lipoprotein-releasing system ATP-binding protein
MSEPVLRLERVARRYVEAAGTLEVFADVNAQLFAGELVGLIGPSGAGKSSLLHMAGLLEKPSGGEVWLGDAASSGLDDAGRTRLRREMIGFVYQAHHLLPEFDALETSCCRR